MKSITLTKDLAYAAGLDAGNANMRKHGRTAWNDDDRDVASEVMNKLYDELDIL